MYDKLLVLQININSLRNKTNEIRLLLSHYQELNCQPIILVNNSRLNDDDVVSFENYYCLRRDHHSNSHTPGGVALLIPNNISVTPLDDFLNIEIEAISIELTVGRHKLKLVTAYPHPGQTIPDRFYDLCTSNSVGKLTIVMGRGQNSA